jgi:DNA repair protein RadC
MEVSELGLTYKKRVISEDVVNSSIVLSRLFMGMYDKDLMDYRESFFVLFFDKALKPIGMYRVSEGGTSCTVVDVKMVFSAALLCGASAMAISHNHPSGSLKPSLEDNKLTNKIKESCKLLDIRFVDHIILASSGKYFSYLDEGLV